MAVDLKLYIQFSVDDSRFVLSAKNVVGVVPLAVFHDIPRAPKYVVGILNYHGQSVPIMDMTKLMNDKRTEYRLSARIILLKLNTAMHAEQIIGLLAEKVTEVLRLDEDLFKHSGVKNKKAEYLGDIITDNHGMLQRLNVEALLPEAAQNMLFG